MIMAKDVNEAISKAAKKIYDEGSIVGPRNLQTKEILNEQIIIANPTKCICTLKSRGNIMPYLSGELDWYLHGDFNVEGIAKHSKFWKNIANKDGTVNSNYGHILFKTPTPLQRNQFEWCAESLLKDKDSRQAVVNFNSILHKYENNKDFVCTMFCQYLIRDNKLEMYTFMRSQDLILGFTYDVPFFCLTQQMLLLELQHTHKDLSLGAYHHQAVSLHTYQNKYAMLKDIANELPLPEALALSGIGDYYARR